MDRVWFVSIFLVFVAMSAKDLFIGYRNANENVSARLKKEIPSVTLKQISVGPTLKFLYCFSCGYRRVFDEYSAMVRQRFPQINIVAEDPSPNSFNQKLVFYSR